MKNNTLFIYVILLLFIACTPLPPYNDISLPIEKRVNDLLKRLTIEEKISLMQNNSPAIERLGIRPYEWWNEALHGVGRAGTATVFPQAIGMGASFDEELVYDVFSAVSDEARVKNRLARKNKSYKRYEGLTFWTPNVNIFRDPRWGRGQETYGEDPFLTSILGSAVVRGLQGPDNLEHDKSHACAKHFAVHSGPEWNRHSFNVENLDTRDLWETYLPAFKTLVEDAKVKEVMCAYNRLDGEPCCGNNKLLNNILREEWGFDGVVVSDCGAIKDFYEKGHHETHSNPEEASADAVKHGTDLECGTIYKTLIESVKKGFIQECEIDKALSRLLRARYELGEMDNISPWDSIPDSVLYSAEHNNLALKMAKESIVLLYNKNKVLPLKGIKKVALIGPNANDSIMQWGNYNGTPLHTVTLLEALKTRLGENNVIYDKGCDYTAQEMFISRFSQCTNSRGNGFRASYWNNSRYDGEPILETNLSTPFYFHTEGSTVFAPGVPITGFSAVYRASFKLNKTEKIAFKAAIRGDYELFINGNKVSYGSKSMRYPQVIYEMEAYASKKYDIELKFIQRGINATLCFDLGIIRPVDIDNLKRKVTDVDAIIFAGGISPALEGEEMSVSASGFNGGDRTDIQLPFVQRRMLNELSKLGKKIIFVNFSGGAVAIEPELESCDAIIQAWYPGQAGGTAISDVLFGDYNPAGRLPVTFYRCSEQLPDFEDYAMEGRTYRFFKDKPLFCFGHGLSYTSFKYGKAIIEGDTLRIPITNIGEYDGDEVVQIYLSRYDDINGPILTLRNFKRIFIKSNETVQASFKLDENTFIWWDKENNVMRPLEGLYKIYYGGSSDKNTLKSFDYRFNGIDG